MLRRQFLGLSICDIDTDGEIFLVQHGKMPLWVDKDVITESNPIPYMANVGILCTSENCNVVFTTSKTRTFNTGLCRLNSGFFVQVRLHMGTIIVGKPSQALFSVWASENPEFKVRMEAEDYHMHWDYVRGAEPNFNPIYDDESDGYDSFIEGDYDTHSWESDDEESEYEPTSGEYTSDSWESDDEESEYESTFEEEPKRESPIKYTLNPYWAFFRKQKGLEALETFITKHTAREALRTWRNVAAAKAHRTFLLKKMFVFWNLETQKAKLNSLKWLCLCQMAQYQEESRQEAARTLVLLSEKDHKDKPTHRSSLAYWGPFYVPPEFTVKTELPTPKPLNLSLFKAVEDLYGEVHRVETLGR